jgi:hypothetical protein
MPCSRPLLAAEADSVWESASGLESAAEVEVELE